MADGEAARARDPRRAPRMRAALRCASRASCATARTRARTSRIPSRPCGSCIGARLTGLGPRGSVAHPSIEGGVIFRSPYPDVPVPDVPLHRFVLARAAELGDKPALIDGPSGRMVTYAQLGAGVDRVAAGLAARGFGKGDVLGLFAPNCPEYALALLGTVAAGGVVTTVNSLATAQDLEYQLRNAGAQYLVTVPSFLDLAVLPYSSGTTGFPKGVMLTHRNLVANLLQTASVHHVAEQDRIIAVLPFFHIYGMQVVLHLALWRGATLVTMPKFELEPFLSTLQQHRITRAFVVPPLVLALAKHPAVDGYDLSSVRAMMSGAAPLDAALETACARRVGCGFIQGYGLTEASPVTHANSDEPGKCKPGTVGELLPNTECRIVDAGSGTEVGPDEDGELLIRGPQVMRGYLNNPEATAATLDGDGWLHTGDIGHVDSDGYFTIVDRLKELIKYKGFQVPPAELEAVLRGHPAVADAAVVPLADQECGEVPKAFVVLRGAVSAADLMAYVAERVAPYKKIRAVEVIDAIPKSPSGKILRRVLKERGQTVRV